MSVSQQFLIRIKCSLDQSTLLNSPQLKITITMLIHFCKKIKTKQKQNKTSRKRKKYQQTIKKEKHW